MSENVLRVENVTMQFGGVVAVDNMNLEVNRDEIVSLIGPNVAGKTTAFNVITGVYAPTNGSVYFQGNKIIENHPQGKMKKLYKGEHAGDYKHVLQPTPDKVTKLGIARTFQNIRLFGELSVIDNVKIGLHNQLQYSALTGVLRLPGYWKQEKAFRERAMDLLSLFDMQDLADHQAGSLPYGAQEIRSTISFISWQHSK